MFASLNRNSLLKKNKSSIEVTDYVLKCGGGLLRYFGFRLSCKIFTYLTAFWTSCSSCWITGSKSLQNMITPPSENGGNDLLISSIVHKKSNIPCRIVCWMWLLLSINVILHILKTPRATAGICGWKQVTFEVETRSPHEAWFVMAHGTK